MAGWIVPNAPPGSAAAVSNARQVAFAAVDPTGPTVYAEIGETLPTFASDGGWQFVARPRTSGFVEYQGVQPYTLTLPVVFDGFANGISVEGPVEILRSMMRNRVGVRNEPAVVKVSGACVPLSWLSWVIQNLEWGDHDRSDTGILVRAFVTVTLYQYLAGDVLVGPAAAAQARATAVQASTATSGTPAAPASSKTYTVKSGDTLSGIAAKLLGDPNRWHDIANLNGIRDPRTLQVGQVLRLP
jgi:LysM repeat protein